MSQDISQDPLKPPEKLKWAYDWKNLVLMIGGLFGGPAGLIFGATVGMITYWVVGSIFLVVMMGFAFARYQGQMLIRIREFAEASKAKNAPEVVKLIDQLAGALYKSRLLFGFLVLVIVALLVVVAWSPVDHYLNTKPTGELRFPDGRNFYPSQEQVLLEQAPFLLATITMLKDEGLGQGKPFRVVLGTSEPFSHPVPKMSFSLELKEGKFALTGFAFRKSVFQGRKFYEPIPLDFAKHKPAFLTVPPSERGDQIFFVGLLTSEGPSEFPENVPDLLVLRPVLEAK